MNIINWIKSLIFKKPEYMKFIININTEIRYIFAKEAIFDISRDILIKQTKAASDDKMYGLNSIELLIDKHKFRGFSDYNYRLHKIIKSSYNDLLVLNGYNKVQYTIYVYNDINANVSEYNAKYRVVLYRDTEYGDWRVGEAKLTMPHEEEE